MHVIAGIFGLTLLVIAVTDAVQTVIVARHVHKLPAITRLFYRLTWIPFTACAGRFQSERRRDRYLGIYGPLSLLLLLGLWAASTIIAFATLQWSIDLQRGGAPSSFAGDIYFSAATFFTIGAGEPSNLSAKYLMVLEAGFGFSFLGLVIGYLPVLYQSFSSRELRIMLLDARAGSPPSAAQLLLRRGGDPGKLEDRLADWEEWALELLQSHLSYPMLAFYRSQHANQSWLAALVTIIDVSAFAMLSAEDDLRRQAEFTFAAGRHALVHTASIFGIAPRHPHRDRLPAPDFSQLCTIVAAARTPLRAERVAEAELEKLRSMYEPHANALGKYFMMALPPWIVRESGADNWQITSWGGALTRTAGDSPSDRAPLFD
jgi:hypothetical protein